MNQKTVDLKFNEILKINDYLTSQYEDWHKKYCKYIKYHINQYKINKFVILILISILNDIGIQI